MSRPAGRARAVMLATRVFWTATAVRAARTFAQTAAAVLGADQVGLVEAPWLHAVDVAGLAAVLAVLTAVAAPGKIVETSVADVAQEQVRQDRS